MTPFFDICNDLQHLYLQEAKTRLLLSISITQTRYLAISRNLIGYPQHRKHNSMTQWPIPLGSLQTLRLRVLSPVLIISLMTVLSTSKITIKFTTTIINMTIIATIHFLQHLTTQTGSSMKLFRFPMKEAASRWTSSTTSPPRPCSRCCQLRPEHLTCDLLIQIPHRQESLLQRRLAANLSVPFAWKLTLGLMRPLPHHPQSMSPVVIATYVKLKKTSNTITIPINNSLRWSTAWIPVDHTNFRKTMLFYLPYFLNLSFSFCSIQLHFFCYFMEHIAVRSITKGKVCGMHHFVKMLFIDTSLNDPPPL